MRPSGQSGPYDAPNGLGTEPTGGLRSGFGKPGLGGAPEKHNDSLFESSKASGNTQRRQFGVRPFNQNARTNEQMMGAGVFGAKMRPQMGANAVTGKHSTVNKTNVSTKPGSQMTSEINSKMMRT